MGFTNLQHQWFLTQHMLSKKTRKKEKNPQKRKEHWKRKDSSLWQMQ